ncbi:DinB family protein [Streptomyces sp. SP17BM10]|uniref:DinB family protein n=1 Tax=Streptomyces sp. SP17BM10 TaxID=3002530 RepID=UPI002E7891BA|nr:DinB family protein [Streptomyces sp. SP17BM10]MEE1785371.1 DinB family protein [Streptomyces sp. SP17BM10]
MTENAAPSPRPDVRPPGVNADEPTTLLTFLDYLREAVIAKLAGLPDDDARRPGVASGTSLLWLVRHLAVVEHNWFEWAYRGVGGEPLETDEVPLDGATVADEIAAYRAAIARSNAVAAQVGADLDRPGARSLRPGGEAPSMRWVLVHMIEETGRHAGHADIIREQVDGVTGR